MKLNYTSLQHPVDPVERPLEAGGAAPNVGDGRSWSCRCTGTWRPRPGRRPGIARGQGRLRADRRRRAAGSLSRDVAELRERGLLCGHITAAPAYGGEHEAISVAGALDAAANRLGWDAALAGPGPGDHRLRDAPRPRRHRRPRQRPRRARAGPADPALARASPSADPRERHRGVSHHTLTVMQLLLGAVEVPVPAGEPVPIAILADGLRLAPPPARRAGRPRRLRGHRPAGEDDGARDRGGPALLRRAPLAGGRCLAPQGMSAARREPPGHGHRDPAVRQPRRRAGGRRAALRGPRPRLPLLPGARARPLAQHAQRVPHRPAPVRRVPRRARDRRAEGPAGRDRRLPRRPGDRKRAPGLLGGDDPPQGRLPALLLQAPAPRRADRRGPDRGAERAAARQEAAPGPQLRRGAEAAGGAARRASRRRSATGRCSR